MGLFDTIKGALASFSASSLPGLIEQAYPGGLDGMLGQLQKSGYGQQVGSWLGHGPNDPITSDDLRNALQNEHVQQIAEKLGIPVDQVLDGLTKSLPDAVDRNSPNGRLEAPAAP